jgi:sugar phosphate permease
MMDTASMLVLSRCQLNWNRLDRSKQKTMKDAPQKVNVRVMFSILLCGLLCFYVLRSGISSSLPSLRADLHLSTSSIGKMTAGFSLCYSLAKLFGGFFSDWLDPRWLFTFALIGSALCNALMSAMGTGEALALLWSVSGFPQGVAFLPCSRLLVAWFDEGSRSSYWSVLSATQNLGQMLLPFLVSRQLVSGHWRMLLLWPAAASVGVAVLAGALLDSTSRVPSRHINVAVGDTKKTKKTAKARPNENSALVFSYYDVFLRDVLRSPRFWAVGASIFLTYFARVAISDWLTLLLTDEAGWAVSSALDAMQSFNVGGLLASASSGFIVDWLLGGRASTICALAMAFFSAVAALQMAWPVAFGGGSALATHASLGVLGFCAFTCVTQATLVALDNVDLRVTGGVVALCGVFAGAGASLSSAFIGALLDGDDDDEGEWAKYRALVLATVLVATALYTMLSLTSPSRSLVKAKQKQK